MKLTKSVLITILYLFSFIAIANQVTHCPVANPFTKIDSLDKIVNQAEKLSPQKTLIVFDIDDTLLTMDQLLGSEQWYHWQRELVDDYEKSGKASAHLVGQSHPELLQTQGILFTLSSMEPTHEKNRAYIKALQKKGYSVLLLTARSFEFSAITQRELQRNDLLFNQPLFSEEINFNNFFLPQLNNGNPAERVVYYHNGLYMVAGQNKGEMLNALLKRFKKDKHFKNIIFVDDRQSNLCDMAVQFHNDASVHLKNYLFVSEKYKNKLLDDKLKNDLSDSWQELESNIRKVILRPNI